MAKKRGVTSDPYSKRNGQPFVLMLVANIMIVFGVLFWIIGSVETGLLTILVAAGATRLEAWHLWKQLLELKKSTPEEPVFEEAPRYNLGDL
jgi:hypothetical protein